MQRLIDADAKIMAQLYDDEHEEWLQKEMTVADYLSFSDTAIPFVDAVPVDAVPWEFLERYADWFCAAVSMPEFVREAKAFYCDTYKAMEGGHIGD